MKSDEEILAGLGKSAEGLLFMSETDHPLEPFRLEGAGAEPDEARLRTLAGAAGGARVEVVTPEKFFAAATAEQSWKGEAELATARRFQKLLRVLKLELADLRVYRVGEIDMRVYVLGKSPSGSWLGLTTRVVET
jgi:hypothetical protein